MRKLLARERAEASKAGQRCRVRSKDAGRSSLSETDLQPTTDSKHAMQTSRVYRGEFVVLGIVTVNPY